MKKLPENGVCEVSNALSGLTFYVCSESRSWVVNCSGEIFEVEILVRESVLKNEELESDW